MAINQPDGVIGRLGHELVWEIPAVTRSSPTRTQSMSETVVSSACIEGIRIGCSTSGSTNSSSSCVGWARPTPFHSEGRFTVGGFNRSSNFSPPDTSPNIRLMIETATAELGIVATIISVLEVAAPRTLAAAGVGTTLSTLLAIPGAFLLGTALREQSDKKQQAFEGFRDKLTASAMIDAVHKAVSMLGHKPQPLNAQGHRATNAIYFRWKQTLAHQIWVLWGIDLMRNLFIEQEWQKKYNGWVDGIAQDFYKIYNDNKNLAR